MLVWICEMYGGMCKRDMFGSCWDEDVQITALFSTVIVKMYTEISSAFYNARFVEVKRLDHATELRRFLRQWPFPGRQPTL